MRNTWLTFGRTVTLALLASGTVACSTDPASPAGRRAAVRHVIAAQLEHEKAMLDILETERESPDRAVARLGAYVTSHQSELEAIGAQRALLEREPAAVAGAMGELQDAFGRVLNLRQRLAKVAPGLMGRDDVREALAPLDAL